MTILELSGKSPYSGRGFIVVPYLAGSKIAVEFKDIVINTDYQLIGGVVETSYNPEWKNVADVEDFTGEGEGGQMEETVPFEVQDIVINANGDIVVNGKDGEQITIPGGKDTVITDAKGNTYTVDKSGNGSNEPVVAAAGGKPTPENTDGVDKNGQATAFTAKGISIAFSSKDSKYAFDVMPEKATAALQKLYKKVNGVALPYKAVLNGDTDTVLATVYVTDTNIKLDSIVFKTQNGAKIDFKRSDKVFELTVKGKLTYAEEQILATVKQDNKWKVIGAFMLVHISRKEVNVALVPTDATSQSKLDAVIAKTQEIYNKVGVKINFKKDNVLNIDSVVSGNTIQTDKNTLTSSYSSDQQKINALYQGTDNSYVLFITNKASSTGQKGYMRLNGQFGYVFATPSGTDGAKTPAHELGHGIFKLAHPFETYKTTESSTDLLMDYSEGTVLNHQDWKQINDPAFKLYAFQSQISGELAKGYALAPDWSFVSNGDETTVKASGDTDTKGFLRGITTKEGTYIWKLKDGKYNYLHETTNKIYENPEVSPNANSTIWLFFENQNSRGKYIRTKYSVVEAIIKSKNETNLSKFIEKNRAKDLYTKGKDENRTTYWGYVGCSNCDSDGVENGNGSGGLVVDKTAKIPADELKQLIAQVSTSNQVNGINAKIFITAKDDTKGIAEVEKAIADLEKSNTREIYIWAKNYVANANFDLELAYGKGLSSKEKLDFDNFEATIQKINNQKESWLACLKFEGTYTYFNPLTAMLDGLAGLIGKAAIPAKYYNPDEPDYNPLPAKIYAYASGKIISEANSTDKYRASRQEFALVCGAWNGLVGTVEAIPAGVSMLMKLQGSAIDVIINHDGARDKLIKTIKNINKEQIDQLLSTIGDEIEKGYKKYTSNPCLVSYASGQAVFVVASLFIGAGEANAAKTFLQTLEKLDVAGQLIGKVFKIGGKFLKPVLNATNKGITLTLEKGVQLFRQVEIKLPNNLYCGIPIPTVKIKSTAAEIEQQLANTVEDANGNKLVEVVLENGEKVPAVVGTEEGLEKIGKSNTKSIFANIDDYINSLTSKSARKKIRANIINLAESKDIAIAFFNNNKNSFEAMYKNDFDKWYDDVFLNGLKKNPAAFEAHHIIPVKVLEGNKELKKLLFELSKDHPEVTFNFNEIDNGMMVQKKSIKLEVDGHGNHPEYDREINIKINSIIKKAGNEKIEAFNQIKKLIKDTKATLKNEVLLGTKNVNDIINF